MKNRPYSEFDLIMEEIDKTGGNLSKVARDLGLDYFALKQRFMPQRTSGMYRPALGPEPADIRTLGRPKFQQYVIAVKRQGSEWPAKYRDVILDARKKFDAGTHEMFQTTDNGWVVQYLIPRLRPVKPRRFFSTLEDLV